MLFYVHRILFGMIEFCVTGENGYRPLSALVGQSTLQHTPYSTLNFYNQRFNGWIVGINCEQGAIIAGLLRFKSYGW